MRFGILLSVLFLLTVNSANATRFTTYNIRNFDYDERAHIPTNKDHLFKTITEVNPDFMAVQEIREKHIFREFIKNRFFGRYQTRLTDCGGAHGQKLGFVYDVAKYTLINFTQDLRTSNVKNPQASLCNGGSRPLAIGHFKTIATGEEFVAITVHLKSSGRASSIQKRFRQIAIIADVIKTYRMNGITNAVVMGDFNSTEYQLGGSVQRKFKDAVKNMGLIDLTKDLECSAYWWGGIQDDKQHPSMLDHILVSPSLMGAQRTSVVKTYGHCAKLQCNATFEDQMGESFNGVSDHCPIAAELK